VQQAKNDMPAAVLPPPLSPKTAMGPHFRPRTAIGAQVRGMWRGAAHTISRHERLLWSLDAGSLRAAQVAEGCGAVATSNQDSFLKKYLTQVDASWLVNGQVGE